MSYRIVRVLSVLSCIVFCRLLLCCFVLFCLVLFFLDLFVSEFQSGVSAGGQSVCCLVGWLFSGLVSLLVNQLVTHTQLAVETENSAAKRMICEDTAFPYNFVLAHKFLCSKASWRRRSRDFNREAVGAYAF